MIVAVNNGLIRKTLWLCKKFLYDFVRNTIILHGWEFIKNKTNDIGTVALLDDDST